MLFMLTRADRHLPDVKSDGLVRGSNRCQRALVASTKACLAMEFTLLYYYFTGNNKGYPRNASLFNIFGGHPRHWADGPDGGDQAGQLIPASLQTGGESVGINTA